MNHLHLEVVTMIHTIPCFIMGTLSESSVLEVANPTSGRHHLGGLSLRWAHCLVSIGWSQNVAVSFRQRTSFNGSSSKLCSEVPQSMLYTKNAFLTSFGIDQRCTCPKVLSLWVASQPWNGLSLTAVTLVAPWWSPCGAAFPFRWRARFALDNDGALQGCG